MLLIRSSSAWRGLVPLPPSSFTVCNELFSTLLVLVPSYKLRTLPADHTRALYTHFCASCPTGFWHRISILANIDASRCWCAFSICIPRFVHAASIYLTWILRFSRVYCSCHSYGALAIVIWSAISLILQGCPACDPVSQRYHSTFAQRIRYRIY
jgi:hypothetical protein